MNILLLIFLGISLSMDTFSLALSMGSFNVNRKNILIFSSMVGIFHFIMPLLGKYLGKLISNIIIFNSNRLLFIIFMFITLEMFISLFSKEEKAFSLSIVSSILLAFSVSIDSFTLGLCLSSITSLKIIPSFIFMSISFFFTMLGLNIGKYSYSKLGVISKIIGLIIMLSLSLYHLFI